MQRKNRPSSNANGNNNNNNNSNISIGYGSGGYETNSDNGNTTNNNINRRNILLGGSSGNDANGKLKSSPSKPPPPSNLSSSGGISIGALTGHHHASSLAGIPSGSAIAAATTSTSTSTSSNNNNNRTKQKPSKKIVSIATVKRNTFGTQPFDAHWLNLDCCGLVCAGLTYALHLYGVYAFGWILIPPWFSVMDEDGYRELTFGCHLHRTIFVSIASLAIIAHFNAMTTDPGAVPPDANPLPDLDELDDLIKGERRRGVGGGVVEGARPNDNSRGSNGKNGTGNNGNASNAANATGRGTTTSALMQEDASVDYDDNNINSSNNNSNNNSNNIHAMPRAVAMAGAVGAAVAGAPLVAGAAAVAGAAGVAGAVASAAGGSGTGSGTVPKRGRRMCRRCQAFKPPRAHHCSICKRCIIKMDHHCPWVNNCVGIGNHKYFLLFIFYTCLSCLYSFLFVVYRFVHCVGHVHSHHHGPRCVDHPTDLLPLVGLAVEALLFGLFTLCMMFDQWDVVTTNLTHIDRLKGETTSHHGHHHVGGGYSQLPQHYHHGGGRGGNNPPPHHHHGAENLVRNARAGINEVFGTGRHLLSSLSGTSSSSSANTPTTSSRFHYTWLSPLHGVCFPDTVRDDIFGYCRPVVCGGGAVSSKVTSCALGCNEGARRISSKSMEMVGRGGEKGRAAGAAEIV